VRILRLGESEDGLIYLVMPSSSELLWTVKSAAADDITWRDAAQADVRRAASPHICRSFTANLKPENVMLVRTTTRRGARRGDGLRSQERRAAPAIAKLTAPGISSARPSHGPEQIRASRSMRAATSTPRIVAFEMFTGKLPFQGRNAQEMMIARLRSQPVPIRQLRSDVPDSVEKRPEQGTADEFRTIASRPRSNLRRPSRPSAAPPNGFFGKTQGKILMIALMPGACAPSRPAAVTAIRAGTSSTHRCRTDQRTPSC